MRRLNILIWHVHGSYLYYLTQAPHEFYVPFKPERSGDYIGRYGHIPWGENVHDISAEEVKDLKLDCIIFQRPNQYLLEQYVILSPEQRRLPKVYLEHDPPSQHPTDTKHFVDSPNVVVVHVTDFNELMWDNGDSPTRVIEHGVRIPEGVYYTGELDRGIVIINHLKQRSRALGKDIYERALNEVPLDLVGMAAEQMPGGLGEVLHKDLFIFESRYRFFFNPIRYTSFPLSLCEAMMIGLPAIAFATTEVAIAIKNDVNGYADTSLPALIRYMQELIRDPRKARELGAHSRAYAQEHFNIERFVEDWNRVLGFCTGFYSRGMSRAVSLGPV